MKRRERLALERRRMWSVALAVLVATRCITAIFWIVHVD